MFYIHTYKHYFLPYFATHFGMFGGGGGKWGYIYNSHQFDQSALQKSKIIPHTQKTDQTKIEPI